MLFVPNLSICNFRPFGHPILNSFIIDKFLHYMSFSKNHYYFPDF